MPVNPTTEGPVKSLRQAVPGGDIVAGLFALLTLLVLVNIVASPRSGAGIAFSIFSALVFGVPAYVLWASARDTGLFVTDARVEYRSLGRVRAGWDRAEVTALEPMGGGVKIMGAEGRELRRYKFRFWSTEQVTRFAQAAGLAPAGTVPTVSAALLQAAEEARLEREKAALPNPADTAAAELAAEVDPGEAGDS